MGYVNNICLCLAFYILPCLLLTVNCSNGSDCSKSSLLDVTNIKLNASSQLNSKYNANNILNKTPTPWVGHFTWPSTSAKNLSIEFNFPRLVRVYSIYMDGGNVVGFRPNMTNEEKCHVERFVLEYKTRENGNWTRVKNNMAKKDNIYKKFDSVTGHYNETTGITWPIISLKILIRKWENCPAVKNLNLVGCGVCQPLTDINNKLLKCSEHNETCTYSCKDGFRKRRGSGVQTCNINGEWIPKVDDLKCATDECSAKGGCGDDANCTFKSDKFVCVCNTGYTSDGNSCTDINECGQNLCDRDATCSNIPGSYTCKCNQGYTGNGVLCNDINECNRRNDCHDNAICSNTLGSYSCKCEAGYTGDGVTDCKDIDECKTLSPCPVHAYCTNNMGSYSCKCKEGFTDGGKGCSDVDECTTLRPCSQHAVCNNTVGSYICKCKEGFTSKGNNNCSGVPPTITTNSSLNTTVRFGETLDLDCIGKGLPEPIIQWWKNDEDLHHNGTKFILSNANLNDSGVYACVASNTEGSDKKEINVFIDGTPSEPESPKIDGVDEKSVTISWSEPKQLGASAITQYIIEYTSVGTEDVEHLNTEKLFIVLEPLMSNTRYIIGIIAVNKQGGSSPKMFKATTYVNKPPVPPDPTSAEQPSSTSVKILLTASKSDGSETKIQIMVRTNPPPDERRRRATDQIHRKCESNYDTAVANNETCYITGQVGVGAESFVVGDGKMYGGIYLNKELEPGRSYEIYLRSVSTNRENVPRYSDSSEPLHVSIEKVGEVDESDGSGNVIGIIAGICVAVLIVIIVVVLVLYIRSRYPKTIEIDPETGKKKRRKRSFNTELLPLARKGVGKRKGSAVEDGTPDPNHPPVATASFAKYVGKLHKSDDRGFMIQYNTLESSHTYASETAQVAENKDKNRYANIIAYDVSRVHLRKIGDDENSDYINASYIDGYNSPNAYIATQGPLECTFNDFWRMVWEKNCPAIIMLTNLQERHKVKCHKYWPDDSEQYGDITVTCTRREQYADYVIRTFHLKMNETEEEREIKQFHFTVWPDHGVPEYPTAILAFQRRLRAYSSRETGSLVIHCSAGVGRSGTFIVIDSMLARIQHEQNVDIYNYVRYLRTRRMFMVQTEEQYVFCHDALLESILCGNTQIAAHNLRIAMKNLRTVDDTTKISGYENEFKTLEKVSPSLPKECFVIASYPENLSKNRYSDILAPDHGRVALNAIADNVVTTYINAVCVDGYKQQNAFILTQIPLTGTIQDFWRLLYEKRSACVVLLSDLSDEGDFPQFWPESATKEFDSMKVEVASNAAKNDTSNEEQFKQDHSSGDIVIRKFKITKGDINPLVVKMFQHLSWKETAVPSDISGIISLVQRIEKWQQRSGNAPITVVCNDGVGRSGTFSALSSVLERVKTEQVVDVFQTIKALRIQRPGLVKNVDQYEFIHNGVQEYLDSFSDYANFK